MQNLTEIRQCLWGWRRNIFNGHTFAIQGVRALLCACFQKECIFYGTLGLGFPAVRVHVVQPKENSAPCLFFCPCG